MAKVVGSNPTNVICLYRLIRTQESTEHLMHNNTHWCMGKKQQVLGIKSMIFVLPFHICLTNCLQLFGLCRSVFESRCVYRRQKHIQLRMCTRFYRRVMWGELLRLCIGPLFEWWNMRRSSPGRILKSWRFCLAFSRWMMFFPHLMFLDLNKDSQCSS